MRRLRRLFLIPFKDKANPYGQAVNPDEFAAAKCSPGGRKQQEEFLGLEDVCCSIDFEPGTGRGNVTQQTLSSPGAIDAHQVDGFAEMLEPNTIRFSVSICHRYCAAAVASEPDSSSKAVNRKGASQALPSVTASWEILKFDEKRDMAIQPEKMFPSWNPRTEPLNNSLRVEKRYRNSAWWATNDEGHERASCRWHPSMSERDSRALLPCLI